MNKTDSVLTQQEELPLNVSFLAEIHEILSRLEVGQDIESLTNKVKELTNKFEQAKQEISSTVGIDTTKDKQEAILHSLEQQLAVKKEIVEKYKNFKL